MSDQLVSSAWLLLELAALFFSVTFAVQLLQRRLGPERLRVWMGGRPPVAAMKGISVGFVTPFCTFTAIPMLVGLRRAGVPAAGYVAFITAAPVLDPVLFGALVIIVGLPAALLYVAVALSAAMTLALVAERVGIEGQLKPVDADVFAREPQPVGGPAPLPATPDADIPAADCASSCTPSDTPWRGLRAEIPEAFRAAIQLLRSVALLLLAGVSIGLVIEAAISPDMVAGITGASSFASIPVAAALGTPLYFDTSLFVPIANSLSNAGVGIGPIVALTIAGAGANIPEFIILSRIATRRLLLVFMAYVFAVAMVGGLLAEALL